MNLTDSNDDGAQAASPMDEAAAYAALSGIALAARPLDQTLEAVTVLAQRALLETPETSVTLLTENEARTAFSGKLALQLDETPVRRRLRTVSGRRRLRPGHHR